MLGWLPRMMILFVSESVIVHVNIFCNCRVFLIVWVPGCVTIMLIAKKNIFNRILHRCVVMINICCIVLRE